MRGEQRRNPETGWPSSGPSPRARGAGRQRGAREFGGGTIPACAGSRTPQMRGRSSRRDHPRVRGEQLRSGDDTGTHTGPSPRARGADGVPTWSVIVTRTIPACAGSSGVAGYTGFPRRDHPRVRGEQARMSASVVAELGPSPRARGADHRQHQLQAPGGTIPACAGSRLRDLQCYRATIAKYATSRESGITDKSAIHPKRRPRCKDATPRRRPRDDRAIFTESDEKRCLKTVTRPLALAGPLASASDPASAPIQ